MDEPFFFAALFIVTFIAGVLGGVTVLWWLT